MLAAGAATGVALVFRLTPAFAVACGIGVGILCAEPSPRRWLRDASWYAAGGGLVVLPMTAWLAADVGLGTLWSEIVLRILPLQSAQSLPIPEAPFPTAWDRRQIYEWFVPVQYVIYPAVYGVTAAILAFVWLRSLRGRRPFAHALLAASVVWGAVYILRALGRSDEHHLTTALPPACLALAVGLGWLVSRREGEAGPVASLRAYAACGATLALWGLLQGSDLPLDPALRGVHRIESLGGRVRVPEADLAARLDRSVLRIRRLVSPDETVLDLTHSPLIHVISGRLGPGLSDVVTPGVFADPERERAFIEHLERNPPALVLWPLQPFDSMPSRGVAVHAPRLAKWVARHYVKQGGEGFREIAMVRRD
jgi:hypothetical protein